MSLTHKMFNFTVRILREDRERFFVPESGRKNARMQEEEEVAVGMRRLLLSAHVPTF